MLGVIGSKLGFLIPSLETSILRKSILSPNTATERQTQLWLGSCYAILGHLKLMQPPIPCVKIYPASWMPDKRDEKNLRRLY